MDHIFRRLSFKELWRTSPVATVLVVVNVLVYILGILIDTYFPMESDFVYMIGINSYQIETFGEYYRLFTAGFGHFDILHILFNVGFGIYIISAGLERLIGSYRFLLVYFISLIGSSLAVYFFVDDVNVVSGIFQLTFTAGASGAIYGVVGALLFMSLVRPDMLSRSEVASIRQLVIINIIFTFLVSNISIIGHLGGLVIGMAISYFLIPADRKGVKDNYVYDYTNEKSEEDNWWEEH